MADLDFEVRSTFLDGPRTKEELNVVSPSGRVPVLIDGSRAIWDSLAIAEYLWERNPDCPIWPLDPEERWYARCIAAEVHAQFEEVRVALPMNLVKRWPITGELPSAISHFNRAGVKGGEAGVLGGLRRMEEVWRQCRASHGSGGPYLFGREFTFVDALYAPMCSRYRTYGLGTVPDAQEYIAANLDSPLMREWMLRAEADADAVGREIAVAYP